MRNIIVHDEFVPLGQGSEIEFDINQVYANTQVSLNGWSQIYAKKAYENAGSYREAARLLGADQRTLKKLVLEVRDFHNLYFAVCGLNSEIEVNCKKLSA